MRPVVDRNVGMRRMTNRKYGAGKLRFPHAKRFIRKESTIWARALRTLRQPCPRPKKNIGLKGHLINIFLGRPHVSGRPWFCGVGWYLFSDISEQPRGIARPLKDGTDRLFHNSLTNYQPTPQSVPEERHLISHVYYQMRGSRSFLTT
jgi:hypothetical protein